MHLSGHMGPVSYQADVAGCRTHAVEPGFQDRSVEDGAVAANAEPVNVVPDKVWWERQDEPVPVVDRPVFGQQPVLAVSSVAPIVNKRDRHAPIPLTQRLAEYTRGAVASSMSQTSPIRALVSNGYLSAGGGWWPVSSSKAGCRPPVHEPTSTSPSRRMASIWSGGPEDSMQSRAGSTVFWAVPRTA